MTVIATIAILFLLIVGFSIRMFNVYLAAG